MRFPLTSVAVSLAVSLVLAASAAAAGPDPSPLRLWSVVRVDNGTGDVPVADGAQVDGTLRQYADLGHVAFNLPLHAPYWYFLPRDRAFGSVYSSADGSHYSVMATAPLLAPVKLGVPKGGIAHLDEYQAYERRSNDASLRITLSDLLLQTIDDNNRFAAWECPDVGNCDPVRTVVRFHARAYAASVGGDFYDVGGTAYLEGHQHSWRPGAATSADSPGPLWGEGDFDVDGDADDSGTGAAGVMATKHAIRLRVPLSSVHIGELFAVHVSLEAEAVDDRGGESAAQAFVQDPQHLLTTHGLKRRGKPRFKEPRLRPLSAARCPGKPPRHAGVVQLSDASYTASEGQRSAVVLVTRTGGSRGSVSAAVTARAGTAQAGRDFTPTSTTVRFADGDSSPRLVEIPLREDNDVEPAETLSVEVAHVRCGALGARHRATVAIVDDDQTPPAPDQTPTPPPFTVGGTVDGLSGATPPVPSGLDPTFGTNGRVSTPVGGLGHGEGVVIQPDGAIVTAGWRTTLIGVDFALTRHTAGGALDTNYGTNGIATTDLGGDDDEAYDAALLPDGGVVAVGRTDAAGFTHTDFGVVHYRPGGTPDPGFDADGIVTTDILGGGDQANAVAVQPDGKIVVAGFALRNGIDGDFAVVRYNADGTRDQSFGTDGIVTTDLGTRGDDARALVIEPDGRIVVAGTADEDIALVRYTAGGHVDGTFGHNGTTITDLGSDDVATGVALTPDGHIAIAGYTLGPHVNRDFLVARYSADGILDPTFGDHGSVKTDVGGGDDFAEGLVVDGAGRFVVVGRATSATILDMALVRYVPDGTPDAGFDGDGIVTADFHGRGEFGQDVALDALGRIVAAGYTANGSDTEFALLRANP